MSEPLNLPQPETILSAPELELVPARIGEIEAATGLAETIMGEGQNDVETPGLEPAPVPLTAVGEPVDMARYRRIASARQGVADSFVEGPEPPRVEGLAA